jgi:hypothetical protein
MDRRCHACCPPADDQQIIGAPRTDIEIHPEILRDLARGRIGEPGVGAKDHAGFVADQAAHRDRFAIGRVHVTALERDAVARQEAFDRLHIGIAVRADHLDGIIVGLELPPPPCSDYGDEVIGQLRHLAHQFEHRLARGLDHPSIDRGTHPHDIGGAIEKADLAEKLRRAERGFQHPFVGMGIDHLDIAFENVDEAVHRHADIHDDAAGWVEHLVPDRADPIDMRGRKRHAAHGFKVLTQCFHAALQRRAGCNMGSGP